MDQIVIREGDFEAFFQAPFDAYGGTTPYVSPLRGDLAAMLDLSRNPLFADAGSALTYFTAHRGARVVGRITAHVHAASNYRHGMRRGYFGFFDVANDPQAARLLLQGAERWLRQRGMNECIGNFNLTAMQQIGVVTQGFENAPYTGHIWSPPHIAALLEQNGYHAQFGMTTGEVDLVSPVTPHPLPDDPDFTVIPVTRGTLAACLEDMRQILNISFDDNPMFVPLSADEYIYRACDMQWIMDRRLFKVLHYKGKPAAVVIVLPDLNPMLRRMGSRPGWMAPWNFLRHRMTNRRAVLIYAGVMPEHQGKGIAPALISQAAQAARRAGYRQLGHTWIGDLNGPSLAQMTKGRAKPLHRLHLFGKAI